MRQGLYAVATAAGLALSAPAMAQMNVSTQTIPLVFNPGGATANFTVTPGAGTFLNSFLFQIPQSGRVTLSLSSLQTGGADTNVNFNASKVQFNGVRLDTISRGIFELRSLVGQAVGAGTSTLTILGAAGSTGTYTGTLAYAIPEPAMWALMIMGFGVAGAAMRMRRRKVRFAV